ncbi:Opacity protein [Enhydrobacter aerosaccus]|uniref:Opacity protein n=1 Tax=Enhydrobacter aerosaccus TaxID=225324 RepID=A0A1T4MYN0_9HYPH|nr:outer membrane beta-barrel protein [Enhydrobacter aerosaccus]SJZ72123.1 Opacity protein [Enhydrobacter aerosaccus]
MLYRRLVGIAALLTCASGSPVLAADDPPLSAETSPSQAQSRAVEPVRSNWEGFYLGGHVGGATGTATFSSPYGSDLFGGSVNTPAFLAGLQAGYNWLPTSQLLLGVEVSGSYLVSQGQNTCAQPNTEQIGATCQAFPNAIASFTGRIGYLTEPNGRTLIYGKAGAAWMHSQLYANPNSAGFPGFNLTAETGTGGSQAVGVWGWTIGAGVEYAVSSKWSLNVGYDYMRFSGINLQTPPTTNVTALREVDSVVGGTSSVTQDLHIARLGLNYHWGGPSKTADESYASAPDTRSTWKPGWEAEVGLRYWYSSGNFQTTNSESNTPNSPAGSNLSYNGMTGHTGELFGRVDAPFNGFVKGYVGGGGITGGTMYDEDWGLGKALSNEPTAYQVTQSNIGGSLSYVTLDLGYNVLRGPDHKIGLFAGYNRYQMSLNATGIYYPTAPSAGAQFASNVPVISDNSTWQSLRLGMSAQVWPAERFRVDADLAYLPYVALNGMDAHWLRNAFFPVNGTGNGVQGELVLSYYVTDAFSIGVGGRYWSMWTNSASYSFGSYEYVTQSTNRYGVFLQGAYRFGTPKQ